jgi:hypothetical protein
MGIVRDPAENNPMIVIPREGQTLRAFEIRRDLTEQNMKHMLDKGVTAES